MNCDDVRSAIYVYLDGEFAGPETQRFERHVSKCTPCATLVQREREFLAAFRARVTPTPMPAELKTRITSTLQAPALSRSGAGWGSRMMRFAAVAAVLAMVSMTVWIFARGGDSGYRPISEAVAAHQLNLPMEVRGSHEHVRTFLQENVPFAVNIPYADADGIELTGARLIQVGRRPAVLFNYEMDGRRVSVIQMTTQPSRARLSGQEPLIEERQGYRVVTYRNRGLTNAVIGPVRMQDVNRLVPASFTAR